MKNSNIVVYVSKSSFVQADIALLQAKEYQFTNPFRQFIYFLFHHYDNYFIWFCDYHALIPILFARLFGKKSYIFVGGYDAYGIKHNPKYGVFSSWFRGMVAKVCYRLCTKIFFVDISLFYALHEHIKVERITNKSVIIPTGYDIDYWTRQTGYVNVYDYITVGNIKDYVTYWRKGIDRFVHMALAQPDKRFAIVGWDFDAHLPSNITVHKFLSPFGVRELLSKSKHYCQLSRIEGLPNSLIEAMLCDCIPVVTDVASMVDVIKGSGYRYTPIFNDTAIYQSPRSRVVKYTLQARKELLEKETSQPPKGILNKLFYDKENTDL